VQVFWLDDVITLNRFHGWWYLEISAARMLGEFQLSVDDHICNITRT